MRCTFCAQHNAQGARVCVSCGKTLTKDARESTSNTGGRPQPASLADGRYRLDRFLGEGGSKIVYLARDTRLERDVAVALIKTEGIDEDGLIRAHREARAMARLGEHPNVVNIYDVGEDDGRLFIVSQYISGGSVEKLLKAAPGHRLAVERALVIASQVCQALAHAHAHGIIHRDLKPANVWLGEDGTAKLGDFGLAISTERTKVTIDGLLAGTAAYLAPEQALGKAPDARADLYSLGAMLFEMLCGRPPFVGQNAISIISQHINTPPVAPSWHNPEIPKSLDAFILGLLAKAPTERPESASAVQERLADIAAAPLAPAKEEPTEATSVGRLPLGSFVGRLDELSTLKSAIDASLGGKRLSLWLWVSPELARRDWWRKRGFTPSSAVCAFWSADATRVKYRFSMVRSSKQFAITFPRGRPRLSVKNLARACPKWPSWQMKSKGASRYPCRSASLIRIVSGCWRASRRFCSEPPCQTR